MKVKSWLVAIGLVLWARFTLAAGPDDRMIWKEFVASLKSGAMTQDRIQPYQFVSKESLMKTLTDLKGYTDKASSWQEWDLPQETFAVGDRIHFLVSLGFGDTKKSVFCFTFLKQEGRWHFQHLENIFIRLDQTPKPPTSEFPDLPADTKAWQREEIYWSQMVFLFNTLVQDKGKESFFNLLKDGFGYFLAAKTWVPFVSPEQAFILYLCWEQSRLRGNQVVLEKLTDNEAVVHLQAQFFSLYQRASHLKRQIAFDDYRRFFETIWQDRAAKAGWALDIQCQDPKCLRAVLRFSKKNMKPSPSATAATIPKAPAGGCPVLRLTFAMDRAYDTQTIYGMLHREDPAGLASRATSMGIDPNLAQKIHDAVTYQEIAGPLEAAVGARYTDLGHDLDRARGAYEIAWRPLVDEFSERVTEMTSHCWIHPEYKVVVSAFHPGLSDWSGDTIAAKFDHDLVTKRRIVAHEIVLSQVFQLLRARHGKEEIADWPVWAFAEITAVLVLDDLALRPYWPQFPSKDYFARSNYPQLASLEAELRRRFLERKSFDDYLEGAIPILSQLDLGKLMRTAK